MKRLLVIPTLLVFALVLVSTALGSPTASAAAPLTGGGSGSFAHAEFSAEAGGVQTSAIVDVQDSAFSDPGGAFEGSFLTVFASRFDPGDPDNPDDDQLDLLQGNAELAPDEFRVSADGSSATLSAVVTMCSQISPDCFNGSVNLSWTGTGQSQTFSGKAIVRAGGNCRIHDTFSDSHGAASATGTVSIGTTNFTPDPSDLAEIAIFSSHQRFTGDCGFLFPPPPGP